MVTRSSLTRGLCLVALTALMSGCSGGGGDETAPVPKGQSGRLVQGPVLNATIFADNVAGGVSFTQDADEVSATTDPVTGDFTLPSVPTYNHVLVSKGGTDKLTGQAAMQMIAPAGSANVTPLTTLVALDTTGTVKAKLEALFPPGVSFDADISTTASPAVLMMAKSVETIVQSMTSAIASKGAAVSAAQMSSIQAQTMQSIAAEFSKPTFTATSMATTAALSSALQTAAASAVANIKAASPNIDIPADVAKQIASSAVSATATAFSIGATAATTAIEGGETAAITDTARETFVNAVQSASDNAKGSIVVSATPDNYTPPPIQVVTPTTVPPESGSQSIGNISFSPATLDYRATTTVSATATSGLAVVFSSTTPDVCTVSGNTITGVATGMCIIAADQAGDSSFTAARQVKASIPVNKASQAITVSTTAPASASNGTKFTVAAAASSGLPVSYFSGSPNVCTNSGATFTMIAATGVCKVQYDQLGNANFNAAPQVINNTSATPVPPANQTIGSFAFTLATLNVGGTTTASASSTSGLAVTFSSSTPNVCSVNGTTVTGLTAGTCTVAANQAGDANYNAAPQVTKDITVAKVNQTIGTITYGPKGAKTTTVAANATSGLAVTFTSGTPGVCTVSGSTVTAVTSGTCTVNANQAGDNKFNAASQVSLTIVISPAITGTTGGSASGTGVNF